MLPVAAIGHLLVVPRAGAVGAALVTAATSLTGAAAACIAAHRLVGTPFPMATLVRAVGIGAVAFWAGILLLPGPGVGGLLGVVALAVALLAALGLTGELSIAEWGRARRWVAAAFRSGAKSAA
jgi:O-antigen/teichoic acid export membrane protein